MVVIAIIALLVSILLPSLQQAKNLAKGLVCKTNLRGINVALMLYTEENKGWIMAGIYAIGLPKASPSGTQWSMWPSALTGFPQSIWEMDAQSLGGDYPEGVPPWKPAIQYIDDPGLIECPVDQRLGEWPAVVNGSYGLNNPMTQGVNFEWTDGPIYKGTKKRDYCYYNLNLTKRAEYMYLGADSNTYYFLVNGTYFRRALRHGNGMDKMHVLFHDGHQEALADTEVRDWEWGMAPWQNSTVKLSPYSLGPLP